MKRNVLITLLILLAVGALAQELKVQSTELPTSKDAKKKGMYVETVLNEEGNLNTFITYDLKKGKLGFDAFTVDLSGKLLESSVEEANAQSEAKYNITIPDPNLVENPGQGVNVLRLVTANGVLGKLEIQDGHFEPKYATSKEYGEYFTTYTPVLRGFRFKEDKSHTSDMRLNIFAAHCKEGDDLEKSYTILEGLLPNTIGYFRKEATIAFMGKDARFDKDSPNASNVVISGQFDGPTGSFKNIKEHVLDYNVISVTTGYDGMGNRSFLLSTLNAPTSVKAHAKFQAKGIPYMTYMTMDTEGNVLQNITFKSNSVRGRFHVYGSGSSHYIFGNINAKHDGYHRWDVGSPTHFQVVKIENGAVAAMEAFDMDQLEALTVTPDGKKAKLKYKDLEYQETLMAPNGDMLVFTQAPKEYYIFQVSSDAKVKAVYVLERLEGIYHSVNFLEANGGLYVLYRTQSGDMVQGIKKSISKGAGYMKNTNFSRVDELTSFGRLVKLDPAAMKVSEPLDFFPDVILGESPMFKGKNGELVMPVRDKKRNYSIAVVK